MIGDGMQQYTIEAVAVIIEASEGGGRQCLHLRLPWLTKPSEGAPGHLVRTSFAGKPTESRTCIGWEPRIHPFGNYVDRQGREESTICISFLRLESLSNTPTFGNETDKLALLTIKHYLVDVPNGVLSSWNDSLHFCQWHGVTRSRRHQRVTTRVKA